MRDKLGTSIYFAMMYLDDEPIAMCAIEELTSLPQITICTNPHANSGGIVSVYTRREFRGKGYQQELLEYLICFARDKDFSDITLTTNTPDAEHIYAKAGFEKISSKYYLNLGTTDK